MNHSVPIPYSFRTSSVPVPSLARARHFKALQGTALQGTSGQVKTHHIPLLFAFISRKPTREAAE